MKSSALQELLEKMSLPERRDLHRWLDSPIHNTRADVRELYRVLSQRPAGQAGPAGKAEVFSAVYPDTPYDDARMNHLMSWLLAQARDFLTWREAGRDEPYQRLLRLRALRRLGLDDAALEKEWQQGRAALDAGPYRDEHYHHLAHLFARERYELAARASRHAAPLSEVAHHAELAARLNRLRFECSAEARKAVSGPPAEPEVAPESPPTLLLYENLLAALRNPADEAAFFNAKTLLERNGTLFHDAELRDLYLLALNYCIRKINSGARQFMREAFELYRSGLANRALFENGVLSPFTYKNAVTAGLALGEFVWVDAFIEEYKPFLPRRERHNAWLYNRAVYHFRRPDYDQAMQLLREADFSDVHTNLDARSMLLRIYYERGYFDALDSLIDSFQTYLRRQKTIGYQRESYGNLLRFVRRLLRTSNSQEKTALRREVQETAAVAEKEWLLRQVA